MSAGPSGTSDAGRRLGSITVVGASLAGLSTARALRAQGFEGRLTLVGDEVHQPYDRPPLSKEFLTGESTAADLALLTDDDPALGIDWLLGTPAAALDPARHAVTLSDGRVVEADAVVLATGARARTLPGSAPLPGVHTLRTLDDAVALRGDLQRASSLVVVGAGFIGAEVASSARAMGVSVTVVEALATPLAGPLGEQMGAVCAQLHSDHGVALRTGVGVAELVGSGAVEGVRLTDGTLLPADVVLVGIGALPNVEWLAGSGLTVAGGIVTDATGATAAPGIYAAGDCALGVDPHTGVAHRSEHWTHALQQPADVVASLLGTPTPHRAVPYFWSAQYGVQLQLAGSHLPGDVVTVVHGSTDERSFVATYERAGELVAVLGLGVTGPFNRWRRQLRTTAAARAVLAG